MNPDTYKLIFDAQITEGADLSQVKARLTALFRIDTMRVEHLFKNAPSVLKRGLTEPEALRYKQIIEKTGAKCRIELEKKTTPPIVIQPPKTSIQAPAPEKELNTCPKCGFKQERGRSDCVRCGIVFERFHARAETEADVHVLAHKTEKSTISSEEETEEEAFEIGIQPVEREGWVSLGVGLVITVIMLLFPFLTFIFSYLKVLVHEFGHAIFGWLFGYPTIPAFDFVYGGGLAMQQDRQLGLLILVYLGLGWLFYVYRQNRATLIVLGVIVLLYTLFAFTELHNMLIIFMGHGAELVFAGIFLYRAISGRGIIVAVERPLYAFVGLLIEFLDLQFAYQLLTSHAHRVDYEAAKGGGHWMDFSRIAEEFLHVNLTAVAAFFLLCCMLTPVLTFLFFRYQAYIFAALMKILRTEGVKNST